MSAIPPISTELLHYGNGRKGPGADSCAATKSVLFDHLVGGSEQVRRDGEAECLGRLEVNNELKLRRLLHRKITGMLTFKDAIDVTGRRPTP